MKKLIGILLVFVSFQIFAQTSDTLVVGYNIVPPFVDVEDGSLTGPSIWLWEHIAEINEFNYTYRKYSLDSLLMGLASGEVDLSASPLTITHDRAQILDFSAPYFIAHESILQNEFSSLQRTMMFVRSVFSINFFRALGALAFVIMVFGLLVWLFERRYNKEQFGHGISGLWHGFWWSAVTMTTVGYGDKAPRTLGGRIVALIWMFTAIIIISGFTAGIASSLTLNKIDSASSHIEDFKKKTLGTIQKSSTDEWLRDNLFTNKKTYHDMDDLMQALDNKEIDAAVYERSILLSVIAADSLEKYELLEGKYNPHFFSIGMREDLPRELQEKINTTMLDITTSKDWKVVLSEYNLHQ